MSAVDYGRRGWVRLMLVAGFIFLYFPILSLIVFSFNDSKRNVTWRGFTLAYYEKALANESLHQALSNSLLIAGWTTVVATVIGTMLGLSLQRYRFRGKGVFESWVHLPIVVPEVCFGVALMVFFAAIRLPLGLTTVILSHIAFSIPFVAVVIRARMASFDPALEEAAHALGASRWQSFRHVTLPHLMVGIVASALLVATLSLDDFVITFFTSGPGATTLPLKIYSMARFSVTPEINAASTVLMALTVMLVLGAVAIQTRWRR
mgnify:FL=1